MKFVIRFYRVGFEDFDKLGRERDVVAQPIGLTSWEVDGVARKGYRAQLTYTRWVS